MLFAAVPVLEGRAESVCHERRCFCLTLRRLLLYGLNQASLVGLLGRREGLGERPSGLPVREVSPSRGVTGCSPGTVPVALPRSTHGVVPGSSQPATQGGLRSSAIRRSPHPQLWMDSGAPIPRVRMTPLQPMRPRSTLPSGSFQLRQRALTPRAISGATAHPTLEFRVPGPRSPRLRMWASWLCQKSVALRRKMIRAASCRETMVEIPTAGDTANAHARSAEPLESS